MVRHHKLSSWQAGSWQFDSQIQDEVKKCYPADIMKEIIKAAHLEKIATNLQKRQELEKVIETSIMMLGVWTKNWSNLPNRPTPAQRKVALKKVEKAAHVLNELFQTLDTDSYNDLRKAMLSDSYSDQVLAIDPRLDPTLPLQYAKFQTILGICSRLEQWAVAAQEHTKKPKDGDKNADIKRWFAEGLIKIWIKVGHEKPTISWRGDYELPKTNGPFMEFVNAAARPLGLIPMEFALRQEIDSWKKKNC